MQHQGDVERRLELCQTLEVDMRLALVRTVLGADGYGKAVHARGVNQLFCRSHLGVYIFGKRVRVALLLGTHMAYLGLYRHTMRMRQINHGLRATNVLGEIFAGGVNHDGGEPARDRLLDDIHMHAVVKMERDRRIGALGIEHAQKRSLFDAQLLEVHLGEAQDKRGMELTGHLGVCAH